MMLLEMATLRRLARLIATKAMVASDEGDLEEAMAAISVCGAIGRHVGEDPILIGMLVRLAVNAIAGRAFEEIVLRHQADPRLARLAAAAATSMDPRPEYGHSIRGEVVCTRIAMHEVRSSREWSGYLPVLLAAPLDQAWAKRVMCDAHEARMISYWRDTFRALREHRGDLMAQYRSCKALGDAVERNAKRPTYELAGILMPVFDTAILKVAQDESSRRLRRVLLGVVAYRQEHGQYPAALSDLPAAAPSDVLNGRPFLYRRTPAGFVLYSVGENLKDDGGKAKRTKEGERPDIVIQYPLVD